MDVSLWDVSWHRGHRVGVGSLLSSRGYRNWTEITMLGRKSLYPLNYFVSPKSISFWDRVSSSPDGLGFAVYSRITKVFIQILPYPSPKYCDYRHRPSCLLLSNGGGRTQGIVHTEQALYQLSYISQPSTWLTSICVKKLLFSVHPTLILIEKVECHWNMSGRLIMIWWGERTESSTFKKTLAGQWWRTPLIQALGRQRQADLC